MPFIPHTKNDVKEMLETIGVSDINTLFDEIPQHLRTTRHLNVPEYLTEFEIGRVMQDRADQDGAALNFIGAGAYEHHIPAVVWDITTRGEFLTAYTPYQAEASQGTLQVIYEYQSMMAHLLGMEVANASLYEGASALAEAILMAVRVQRKKTQKRVLICGSLHPYYRQTIKTLVGLQGIELIDLEVCTQQGRTELDALTPHADTEVTAIVIAQPNFFGCLERVDELVNWAHQRDALAIACVNPMAMAVTKEPGQWGDTGADIACGEGQPLGVPLASGGPYFGFMACKQVFVRQMPGRLVGRTVDTDGKPGFVLTLQAREQHIRRSKATSNICTNQGLLVTAATVYMSLLGFDGLQKVATQSMQQARVLQKLVANITGVELIFTDASLYEFVLRLPQAAEPVLAAMAQQGIQAGYDLSQPFPALKNCILVCVTETKTDADLQRYANALATALKTEKKTDKVLEPA